MRLAWGRAPRAALGSPVTVLVAVVTGLVVAFVAASTVFHVSASGSAAVQYVTAKRCPDESGLSIERGGRGLFATHQPDGLSERMEILTASARRNGLDTVRRTRYAAALPMTVGGKDAEGRLVARDGAQERIRPLSGGGTDGVWLPSQLAETFGASVGDELVLATDAGPVRLPVTAVYPTLSEPLDDFWCSQRSEVIKLVGVPERTIRPSVLLVSPELMSRLVADGLPVFIDRVQLAPAALPKDRAGAERLAAGVAAVRAEVEAMDLDRPVLADGRSRTFTQTTLGDRAAYPAASAGRAQQAVGSSLLPLTLTSLLVGLAAVAGLAGLWVQRRFAELRLLWTRGASPASLGGKAVLELGLPLLLGAAMGWAVAMVGAPLLAPAAELDPWAAPVAAVAAGIAWLVGVAVLAAAATGRVRRRFQPSTGTGVARRAARWMPWELLAAGAAVLSWRRLSDGALVVSAADLLPRVDVLALMFPLMCLAVLVGVGVRLAGPALRAGHRFRGWRLPAVLWAARRAAAQQRLTVALLAVAGLAVGVVAVGVGISATERAAVLDKGRLFVGSDTAVRLLATVPDEDLGIGPPAALRGSVTQIGVRDIDLNGERTRVLALDPATVTDGMPWRPEWGGGVGLAELVSRLGPADADGRAPVLAFGATDPQLLTPDGLAGVRVVGAVDTFPGREHADSMIVMSWEALATGDRRGFTRYVLTRGDTATVVRELEAAGEPTGWVFTAEDTNDALPFLVVAWTFDFFVTLGAVLAAVALAALLVVIEARRRATAVAHALLARMGLRARTLYVSQLVELAALAVCATVLGLFGGWLVLATASTKLDPAPFLSPAPVPASLVPLATLVALVAAAAVLLTAAVATRAAVRAPVRDLLRGVAT